jgi:hypothetical protein
MVHGASGSSACGSRTTSSRFTAAAQSRRRGPRRLELLRLTAAPDGFKMAAPSGDNAKAHAWLSPGRQFRRTPLSSFYFFLWWRLGLGGISPKGRRHPGRPAGGGNFIGRHDLGFGGKEEQRGFSASAPRPRGGHPAARVSAVRGHTCPHRSAVLASRGRRKDYRERSG